MQPVRNINDILTFLYDFFNALIPILIAAAVVYFLYGLIRFVVAGPEDRSEVWKTILTGIVVLTVMVALWGLVNILITSFGLNATTPTNPGPQLPGIRSAM